MAEFQSWARAAIADCAAAGGRAGRWSAARPCTSGRSWTTSCSPGPIPPSGPGWEAELAELGAAGAARAAGRAGPGGRRGHPARQRPPDRAGAGGHRADRRPFPRRCPSGDYAAAGGRPARAATRPRDPGRRGSSSGSTGCGPPGWSTRCARWSQHGLRDGPDGLPGARLPAGARSCSTGEVDEARGARSGRYVATRRFARRQDSWFRRTRGSRWLAYDGPPTWSTRSLAVAADR